ncbi:MAG: single-stranded DNA-binding protein [Oscillospiraceae bacterium]|nr:single-stranded DNA-binding protein [Oscillospiraceae bacterium]MBQ7120157.1 single-stranded DNA-binding protein [Oscillospiraceae bacterium]
MLNKVILMGRLTKDPELRHTQSGLPVVSFSLAVDRGFKADGQSVDFINIVAWRNTAEFVAKWFSKGQLVAVSGRLQARTYKDREGSSRVITEVVADEVYFAEKKREAVGIGFDETEPALPAGEFEAIYGEDGELPF